MSLLILFSWLKLLLFVCCVLILFFNKYKHSKILILTLIVLFCIYVIWKWWINSIQIGTGTYTFKVKQINKNSAILQDTFLRDFVLLNKTNIKEIKINEWIYLKGKVTFLDSKFDFFLNKGIYYQIQVNEILNVNNSLKSTFFNLELFNYKEFQNTIMPLIFGYTSEDLSKNFSFLGVIHLVVLSGFHFNIIHAIFKFIFRKTKLKIFGSLLFLSIYFAMCNWNISAVKSFFLIVLIEIYQFASAKNINVDKTKFLIIVAGFVLIINPWFVTEIGYWFTFLLSGFLYLFENNEQWQWNKKAFKKYFKTWMFSTLLVLLFRFEFYPLSFLFMLFLSPLIEFYVVSLVFLWWIKPVVIFYDFILKNISEVLMRWSLFISFQVSNLYLKTTLSFFNVAALLILLVTNQRATNKFLYN